MSAKVFLLLVVSLRESLALIPALLLVVVLMWVAFRLLFRGSPTRRMIFLQSIHPATEHIITDIWIFIKVFYKLEPVRLVLVTIPWRMANSEAVRTEGGYSRVRQFDSLSSNR